MDNGIKMDKEIVIVTQYLGNDGAPRVLTELMTEWVQMGVKVYVIQTEPSLYNSSYPISNKVILIDTTDYSGVFRRLKKAKELVRFLAKHKRAVVISFVNRTNLICGIGSLVFKNMLVFSERNDPNQSPPRESHRIIRDQLFRLADICVFQTETAMQHFSKNVQIKGHIIPNPINPELPTPFEGERKKTIIAVGRLTKQKNFSLLISAFEKFHIDFPEYLLEIYGRGKNEEEEALRILIDEKNLASSAYLMGFSDDIYSKMIDCAMYVSSSNYEGISNSMLEALGMGIPSICTDCPVGGAGQTITDGENGLLIPVGDVDALYNAMVRIASDSEFATYLSNNAVQIREELDVRKIAAEWLKVIDMIDGE